MAKRSQRRPLRLERDQAGCMWSFISIFDFRNGRSNRKLLADRRRASRKAAGAGYSDDKLMVLNSKEKPSTIEDDEERKATTIDVVKTRVKELMEEEMFKEEGPENQTNGFEIETKQFDSKHGNHQTGNNKRTKKSRRSYSDLQLHETTAAANSGNEESFHQVTADITSNNLDLQTIVKELSQIHPKIASIKIDLDHNDIRHSNHDNSGIKEKLNAAIEVFANQTAVRTNLLEEDEKALHYKEFMNALQTLSSNKDLFLQLLQDPNSDLVKHIECLKNNQLEKDQKSGSLLGHNLSEDKLTNAKTDDHIHSKHRNFFRKRSKSQESFPSTGNDRFQSSSKIVILKPGPAGFQQPGSQISSSTAFDNVENEVPNERKVSHFSFTEIKRRLKHAMGKEQHGVSLENIDHYSHPKNKTRGDTEKGAGGENLGWSSPNRNHFYTERFAKPPANNKRGDKNGKFKDAETARGSETSVYPKPRVSNIYIEAKKHLLEMLNNEDESVELTSRQLPKSLGRILSLPEYSSSPCYSPRKKSEENVVTAEITLSPRGTSNMHDEKLPESEHVETDAHLSSSMSNIEGESCNIDENRDDKLQSPKVQSPKSDHNIPCEFNHESFMEGTMPLKAEIVVSEGFLEIDEITQDAYQDDKNLNVSCESSSSSIPEEVKTGDITIEFIEEIALPCVNSNSLREDHISSAPASPSSTSGLEKIEEHDGVADRLEGPSPISVLAPPFTEEEDISPAKTISEKVQFEINPRQIQFEDSNTSTSNQGICARTCPESEESAFEYVEAVLLGSELNWNDYLLRWLSSDQILDPSLFDEVELFSSHSSYDQKLLFDCTNEVLNEVCHRYFGCCSGTLFVKQNVRPVPKNMSLIYEVWEGVEWYLLQNPPPHSLDQLVKQDLDKSKTWMDLRLDFEHLAIEMEDVIFEELVEETILSIVNGNNIVCKEDSSPADLCETNSACCEA